MDKVFLPALGKSISKAGLGCVTFGREIDRSTAFAIMDCALEKEISFFDTAAAYGGGASEEITGQWFAERGSAAEHVILATKLLPPFDGAKVAAGVEQSLRRLGRDRVDLVFAHSWHPSILDEPVLRAMDALVVAGKTGALGVSNFNAEQLRALLQKQAEHNFTPVSFIQNNQNYAVRHVDDDLRQLCREFGVQIVTYSPLGAGFLTGKYRGAVSPDARFEIMPGHKDVYFNDQAWQRLDQLMKLAEAAGKPVAALALGWAFRQPQVSSVLIGCRTTAHLDQALAAMAEDAGVPA